MLKMRRGVFKPDDTDRSNNSALFGGTVSDSRNALAGFLVQRPNNHTKRAGAPVATNLYGYSVCHTDLLRVGLHNLRHDPLAGRFADDDGGGASLLGGLGCDTYLCRPIGVAMVADRQRAMRTEAQLF